MPPINDKTFSFFMHASRMLASKGDLKSAFEIWKMLERQGLIKQPLPGESEAPLKIDPAWLGWANEPLCNWWNFNGSLDRFRFLNFIAPSDLYLYERLLNLYLEGRLYEQAAKLIQSLPESALTQSILLAAAKLETIRFNFPQALSYCKAIIGEGNIPDKLLYQLLLVLGGIRQFPLALEVYKRYALNKKSNYELAGIKFWLEMAGHCCDRSQALAEYASDLASLSVSHSLPLEGYLVFARVLAKLAKADQGSAMNILTKCCLPEFQEIDITRQAFPKKACMICHVVTLPYFGPILLKIKPGEIDLIVKGADKSDSRLREFIEAGYRIYYDANLSRDYQYVIQDMIVDHGLQPCQKVIGLYHGSDGNPHIGMAERVSAAIVTSEKFALYKAFPSTSPITQVLINKTIKRCELAFSGPYHCAEYVYEPKEKARRAIADKHGFVIPNDRPCIYCPEGEASYIGQLIRCINKISRYATVIFKPFYIWNDKKWLSKVEPGILIIKDRTQNVHELRFASDFVLASFWSGTATTSLLLGQPVIIYHSRYEKFNWETHVNYGYQPYKRFLAINDPPLNEVDMFLEKHVPRFTLYSLALKFNLLFDLVEDAKYREAILSPSYLKKYYSLLPILQEKVFGQYFIENATQRTADLIMKFIKNDSFGEDCAAVSFAGFKC